MFQKNQIMSKQLYQKRKFTKKVFKLRKDEIDIFESSLGEEDEYSIDYLHLGVRTYKSNARDLHYQFLFLSLFLVQISVLVYFLIAKWGILYLVIWSLLSGLFLGLFLVSKFGAKKRTIMLTGGERPIEFFQDQPTEMEVDEFVEETISRIKKAYKAKYLNCEKTDTIEAKKERVEWLKKLKIISEEEMNEIIKEIETKTFTPIGFMRK